MRQTSIIFAVVIMGIIVIGGGCPAESCFTTGSFPTTNTCHGCSDRDASHANDHGNGTCTGI